MTASSNEGPLRIERVLRNPGGSQECVLPLEYQASRFPKH